MPLRIKVSAPASERCNRRDEARTAGEKIIILKVGRHDKALSSLFTDGAHLGLSLLKIALAFVGHLFIALQVKIRRVARPLVLNMPILTTSRLIRIGGVWAFFLRFTIRLWARTCLIGSLLSPVQLIGLL